MPHCVSVCKLLSLGNERAGTAMEAVMVGESNRGWAFFPLNIAGPAALVQAAVPDEWLWHDAAAAGAKANGKRPRRQCGKLQLKPKPAHGKERGLHATVLLKLPGSALHPEVARLREICSAAKDPISFRIAELFVSKVNRITDDG